ncbi:hypothetical protein FZEAL_560, partial [Fusarium zealandicum]
GALLSDIHKGRALKKAVTNDRSAPIVASTSSSSAPPVSGAPPVPGLGGAPKPPGGLAPPVPGNRARSNSDQGSRDASSGGADPAPQLGGLFAGGMPKLKKRGGGVDTGANRDSTYLSDPEPTTSAPRPPAFSAPRPPPGAAPAIPGRPLTPLAGGQAGFRKTTPTGSKPPPPPIGKKPPPLPTSRKPSSMSLPPSLPTAPAPTPPLPPPPPPTSSAPVPAAPPPPPPSAAPPRPSQSPAPRSQPPPPPPPAPSHSTPSLAAQAAIRAAEQASPSSAPPPPPPPPPASAPAPPTAPSPPPPPATRSRGSSLRQSMFDPSMFTLTANGAKSPSPTRNSPAQTPASTGSAHVMINDTRWQFKDEGLFPKPRDFSGGIKKYRAGRGSSVPLDLSAL